MGKLIFDEDVECYSCGGTGIYAGMGERSGAAVICHTCEGTGKTHVHSEYNTFEGRKDRPNVERVYKTGGGYCISSKDVVADDGRTIHFSTAGASYEDWKNGKEPEPIYDLHCPLQHFGQGTDIGEYMKDKGPCAENLTMGSWLCDCCKKHREYCWVWYEKVYKNKAKI